MGDNSGNSSTAMVFDLDTISMLQTIFKAPPKDTEPATEEGHPKTASVKFMITMRDREGLRALGYSQEQINKMKPQEAEAILQSGAKAESPAGACAAG